MKISEYVDIDSPRRKIWGAITDFQNCAEMISGIVDVKILNQPEEGIVGLKWTEIRKMFGKESSETMWITESRDEEYYVTRAENHGAIYVTKMGLSESDGKTRLTMSFSGTSESAFVKATSAIMGVFFKKPMIKMVKQDLEDIKNFVEKS